LFVFKAKKNPKNLEKKKSQVLIDKIQSKKI